MLCQASAVQVDDSKQIISDEQMGRAMAQVMCSEKSQSEAVDYFNLMNLPKKKMENLHLFPDVIKGYLSEGGADCSR